ncbi:MAG: HAD-IIA family hydrolase [Christensenellales bacterium]|jgi:HAD superfamily hydrolase (TIGR01450 family)|nr:HAD-IIA family hydrolase [Clostridiales bacterium]
MKSTKDIDLFLFDLDGTINMGDIPLKGAIETLTRLTENGKRVCFVTNNSSKSKYDYLEKIRRLGYNARIEQIITSGMATAQYLSRHRPYKSVYVLGTDALKREMGDYGIEMKEDADIVVLGFDTSLTYDKLFHACILLEKGREYIATHPDFVCPSEFGNMPDTGAIMALIEKTNGRRPSVIIGKPYAPMAEFVFDHCHIEPNKVAMVGDRLYTDVLFGKNNKMTSILVLTGETTIQMLNDSDIKPDIVLESVNDIEI